MGSFKFNPTYIDHVLGEIMAAFDGELGASIANVMREKAPMGKDKPLKRGKKRRKSETRREVLMTYAEGKSSDPRSYFGSGRSSRQFDLTEGTQIRLAEELRYHYAKEKEREFGSRKADPFAGLEKAKFLPASETTRGMTAAQSRSIVSGSFMQRGNLRITDGKMFAVFPARKRHGKLKESIKVLDVYRDGNKATMVVGNDPEIAPYGIYVEMGLHPHKGMKKQPFARETLAAFSEQIHSGSLLKGILKG